MLYITLIIMKKIRFSHMQGIKQAALEHWAKPAAIARARAHLA